ncbi:MAG: hypothetical protein ACLUKN_09345 [Bacilli bacterium]
MAKDVFVEMFKTYKANEIVAEKDCANSDSGELEKFCLDAMAAIQRWSSLRAATKGDKCAYRPARKRQGKANSRWF